MSSPLVSVVMPVYNAQPYLTVAVTSILEQTYTHFELIIIEDGSTDGSLKTLHALKSQHPEKIKLLQNGSNQGVIYSLNKGIAAAQGKYIARMDADDIAFQDRLAQQVGFLEQHPDYGLVGTGMLEFQNYRIQRYWYSFTTDEKLRVKAQFNSPFAHPTVMMRRAVLDTIAGYNLDYPVVEDYRLWLDIMNHWKVANLKQPLLFYRIHHGNTSKNRRFAQRQGLEKIYSAWLSSDTLSKHYFFATALLDGSEIGFKELQQYALHLLNLNKQRSSFYKLYVTILYSRVVGKYSKQMGWKVLQLLDRKLILRLPLLQFLWWGIQWKIKDAWYKIQYQRHLNP